MKKLTKQKKLWQTDVNLDPDVEKYTVGQDYLLDQKLLPYDIEASIAHAKGLKKIGILNAKELQKLEIGLKQILSLWQKGKFIIKQEQEDGHTAIEQYLTSKCGNVGKKIHTGRSRNDQALVMTRLFIKEELKNIIKLNKDLIKSLQKQSKKYNSTPMPGYTHAQKAMPTTVGVWLDSFVCAIKDLEPFLITLQNLINQSPLGSASGFGIANLKLDKKYTAKLLGFKKVQTNPQYCGLSRGHFENIYLQTLSPIMITIGRLANDLLLFTTQEFDFFALPINMTTGSSIMPQKRNYDVLEVIRANSSVFSSYQFQIQNIIKGLTSGYHRDLPLTKKPLIEGVELIKNTLKITTKIVDKLIVKKNNLNNAMTDDLYATQKVYILVKQGVPFREAYKKVKVNLK